MTTKQTKTNFKKRAEASFKRANPEAKNVKFIWQGHIETFPNLGARGTSYLHAMAEVSADGYRTRKVHVTLDLETGSLMIR